MYSFEIKKADSVANAAALLRETNGKVLAGGQSLVASLKLRLSQRFSLLEHEATLKLGRLYEQSDYSAPTPAIDATRDDDRNRFQAELELPLGRQFFGLLDYEYGAFASNLQSADYDQHVVSVRLGLKI